MDAVGCFYAMLALIGGCWLTNLFFKILASYFRVKLCSLIYKESKGTREWCNTLSAKVATLEYESEARKRLEKAEQEAEKQEAAKRRR